MNILKTYLSQAEFRSLFSSTREKIRIQTFFEHTKVFIFDNMQAMFFFTICFLHTSYEGNNDDDERDDITYMNTSYTSKNQ